MTHFGLPLCASALVVAAFAPFGARGWGEWATRRAKERSARLLATARSAQEEHPTFTHDELQAKS